MKIKLLALLPMAMMAGPVLADQAADGQVREMERLAAEQEKAAAEKDKQLDEAKRKLEEAQRQLAEAAREVAELGMQSDAEFEVFRQIRAGGRRAMLGINIGAGEGDSSAGVLVDGVTPGGPAADAGLKSGDVITKVNEQSVVTDSARESNRKLIKLMRDVEPGQDVKVTYKRDDKTQETTVHTTAADAMAFGFIGKDGASMRFGPHPDGRWEMEIIEDGMAPPAPMHEFFRQWGGMEMVNLTPELGEYFGTDKGLLVVRSPGQKDIDIRDGDVLLQIGGRTPDSPAHATRILRSYQPGEKMPVQLIRKKKKVNIEITMPDRRISRWVEDGDEIIHEIVISPEVTAPPAAPTRPATRT
jgi:hypothetical protein